jgi:hypothetical protein
MGLAPLDTWARVLLAPPARVPPRYWPRLACVLATSALATLLTLPERLVLGPVLAWRGRRCGWRLRRPVVVVLGYFRSGTTHLHYLLSCDPRFRTPAWCETLAPGGFAASWWFLRWFLVPFLSNSRPQDDVAFGPEWPSEDDFATSNWALASTLPGRFIVPGQYDHYERFNSLDRLTDRERARWRRTQAAFCWKLLALSPRKHLLLKTPSHTARVAELSRMFGDRLRVIHISRDPDAVVRSNVRMAERLEPYSLEPTPDAATVRSRVVAEYADSEDRFTREAADLPPGRVALLRFEDLIADPLGSSRRCYDQLGLGWTDAAETRFRRYLGAVRDYKPRHGAGADKPALEPTLGALAERFGHTAPAIEPVPLDLAPPPPVRTARGIAATWVAALVLGGFWLAWAAILGDRTDPLMWIFGVTIGLVAVRVARRGSLILGINAVAALAALLAACFGPVTLVAYVPPHDPHRWSTAWGLVRDSATAANNLLFMVFGLVSAFRVATRVHVRPPGT